MNDDMKRIYKTLLLGEQLTGVDINNHHQEKDYTIFGCVWNRSWFFCVEINGSVRARWVVNDGWVK